MFTLILAFLGLLVALSALRLLFWTVLWLALQPVHLVLWVLVRLEGAIRRSVSPRRQRPTSSNSSAEAPEPLTRTSVGATRRAYRPNTRRK